MEYSIDDNFLEVSQLNRIKEYLTCDTFPYYIHPEINVEYDKASPLNRDVGMGEDFHYQMSHVLYVSKSNGLKETSNFFVKDIFDPLLNKIPLKFLLRMKVNFYSRTETLEVHKMHTDYNFKHKACIFYINSNDGYTTLENDIKIESVENRLLTFEGHEEHCSTNCTNKKFRVNINFNYLENDNE